MVLEAYQKELYLSIIIIGMHRALLDSTFQIASVTLFWKKGSEKKEREWQQLGAQQTPFRHLNLSGDVGGFKKPTVWSKPIIKLKGIQGQPVNRNLI